MVRHQGLTYYITLTLWKRLYSNVYCCMHTTLASKCVLQFVTTIPFFNRFNIHDCHRKKSKTHELLLTVSRTFKTNGNLVAHNVTLNDQRGWYLKCKYLIFLSPQRKSKELCQLLRWSNFWILTFSKLIMYSEWNLNVIVSKFGWFHSKRLQVNCFILLKWEGCNVFDYITEHQQEPNVCILMIVNVILPSVYIYIYQSGT